MVSLFGVVALISWKQPLFSLSYCILDSLSTAHGALGLSIKGSRSRSSPKLQGIWVRKSMLIIDEISMTGLRPLHEIETQCRVVHQNDSECGGLSVILLCGDF